MKIGRITLIDPTLPADQADKYGAAIDQYVGQMFEEPSEFVRVLVSNREALQAALLRLCDDEKCLLVLTTGGTGPARADIVPETTSEILDKELPGFGEVMRHYSYEKTPLAILSRAVAGVRGRSLVINLPSRPKAVEACLKMLREAMVECIEQNTGHRLVLYVSPMVIPLEKWLPFLKRLRPATPGPQSKA